MIGALARAYGFSPAEIWALSLTEIAWLTAPAAPAALTRAEFTRLLTAHPDERRIHG